MSLADQVRNVLYDLHERLNQKIPGLKKRLAEIETEQAMIKAELDAADFRTKHLTGFKPVIDGDAQCARCFLTKGKQVTAKAAEPATESDDLWVCPVCHFEFSTEV